MYTSRTTASPKAQGRQPARGNPMRELSDTLVIPRDYHGEMLRGSELPEEPVYEGEPSADMTPVLSVQAARKEALPPVPTHRLLDGVFDLLLGNNSDEEETILLLGVAVLLLSGHFDRRHDGGNLWSEDDLALLLIGYLLLG